MPWIGAALVPEHHEARLWLNQGERFQAAPGIWWVVPWSGVWPVTWIAEQQRAAVVAAAPGGADDA